MTSPNPSTSDPRGLRAKLGRFLASPWAAPAAVVLALLLTFRSVGNGLDADDYFHRAIIQGSPRFSAYIGGPRDMFRFMPRDPGRTQALMDVGFLPWWTYPPLKVEFFQLLTVETHILDYRLWPDRPDLMHIHSLAWFALLVFLAARFYRRVLGATWMAGAAALLLAVDDAHGTPVGWICNRNVMLAACFGFGSLIAHDAWRRQGRRWAFFPALLLWACSLCSKEEGIATSAYLIAYALWLDEATLPRRLLTLVPYGAVLVAWRIVRDGLGYGVADFGVYVDPITDPARYVAALVERYPIFLLGQWGFPPSDVTVLMRKILATPIWWSALSFACVLGLVFWPLLRRDRLARFFATGMLLAIVPVCATFPTDRLLMFSGLGAMGLLVRFWQFVFAGQERPKSRLWRLVALPLAVLFIFLHGVVSPIILTFRATAPTGPRWFIDRLYVRIPFDKSIDEQDLVVVNPPSPMHAAYCLLLYEHDGLPSPRAVRTLAPGFSSVTVRRPDAFTLEAAPQDGYLDFFFDRLFRNEEHPLAVGEEVRIARMSATVLSLTADGRPANVAFRFDCPLEDPSLRWLRWHRGRFVPFAPPAIGQQVELKPEWRRFRGGE